MNQISTEILALSGEPALLARHFRVFFANAAARQALLAPLARLRAGLRDARTAEETVSAASSRLSAMVEQAP